MSYPHNYPLEDEEDKRHIGRVHKKRKAGWPALLTKLRLEQGLTFKEARHMVIPPIGPEVIERYERGQVNPSLKQMERILQGYGYRLTVEKIDED